MNPRTMFVASDNTNDTVIPRNFLKYFNLQTNGMLIFLRVYGKCTGNNLTILTSNNEEMLS